MKKTNNKRTLTVLLALAMMMPTLASTLASCSENTAEETETTAEETVSSASADTETETETVEEETELQPNIPELDFDGATFTILTSGSGDTNGADWVTYDVYADTITGEPINDAVFERNEYLNKTYNIKLEQYQTSKDTLSELKTEVTANTGTFQAAMTHFENGATLGRQGMLIDLYTLPYIDVSQPWWDQSGVEELEVMGSLYQATGDITVIDNDATWVLFFNKQLREDLGYDNIYDLVREDKWNFDTFFNMVSTAYLDVNGDSKMSYQDDRFGLITSDQSAYGLLYAAGVELVTTDDEEVFKITSDTEYISGVIDSAATVMADNNITFITGREGTDANSIRVAFQEGKGLFYGEVMQCATRMRDSDTDFGLVPWPKYTETQDRYYNWIHSSAGRGVVIPASVASSQYEMVGAIVEAMAAKSMYTLTEAYYDKSFTYKSLRDEDSVEMLEIVLQSRSYDLANIYSLSLSSTILNCIVNNNGKFASSWKSQTKLANKILDKAIKGYEEIKAQ